MSIVSNFAEYNDKGILTRFVDPIIHSLNKHEIVKEAYDSIFVDHKHTCAIVIGDIIEDSTMLANLNIPT